MFAYRQTSLSVTDVRVRVFRYEQVEKSERVGEGGGVGGGVHNQHLCPSSRDITDGRLVKGDIKVVFTGATSRPPQVYSVTSHGRPAQPRGGPLYLQ